MELQGTILDPVHRTVFEGTIVHEDGKITEVAPGSRGDSDRTFMPGFVDAHVHIESAMLVPSEFARVAVTHGTIGTVSDPHEIANVLGLEGVRYMLRNAARSPFKFHFGAPSCVPATTFETSGATLGPDEVEELLDEPGIGYLSEVMNYPGVVAREADLLRKISAARERGMPVDGHAPGVRGEKLRRYVEAGISTDHESFAYEEGREKLQLGLKLLIREGSAARNFDELHPLLSDFPEDCMFCSDDKHPDDLLQGHIDVLVRKAIDLGHDRMTVIRSATVHPVHHYRLPVGLLQPGDPADFIEVESLKRLNVLNTWIDGELVASNGQSRIPASPVSIVNNFEPRLVEPAEFSFVLSGDSGETVHIIGAIDGQIVTNHDTTTLDSIDSSQPCSVDGDLLEIAVVNRYRREAVSKALIRGFGLKRGAIASSVAHDSHNIVAVGTNPDDMAAAANLLMETKGGLVAVDGSEFERVELPAAGLMSDNDGWTVGRQYAVVDEFARRHLGSVLEAPFMTLSFMALLVIPSLKISDKGLFDGSDFSLIPVVT